jgi:hypothetical protein
LIVDLEERLRGLSGSNDTAPFSTGILLVPLSRHQRGYRSAPSMNSRQNPP